MEITNDNNPDFFRTQCIVHNLKITPQRILIYNELTGAKNHPTVDNIYRSLHEKYPNISFDTVNRTLLTFYDIGLVDIIESPGSQRRFDPNKENHHHLHCIKCGKIIDFTSSELDALSIPLEVGKHFKVLQKRVVINGICEDCQKKTAGL